MIVSPIYLTLPRNRSAGKRISLNMNTYRNLHFQVNNQAKHAYRELMREQIQSIIGIKWPIKPVFRYFIKRRTDIGNIHSVVEKFFLDALVEMGRLPDDGPDYVVGANYEFAGYDTKNPRCEIELEGYGG